MVPDGRELFYMSQGGQLTAVPVETEGAFSYGNPEVVFEASYVTGFGATYDISPDGKRFLMIKPDRPDNAATAPHLVLVQNWTDELKRLVPVDH